VSVLASHPSWNYTTFLNIAFLLLTAVLAVRFLRTRGVAMLQEMEAPPAEEESRPRDPGCGMAVDPATARQPASVGGRTYWF